MKHGISIIEQTGREKKTKAKKGREFSHIHGVLC